MIRLRFSTPVVTLLTAAYLVSSIGCATGAFRQTIAPADNASAIALPSSSPTARVAYEDNQMQRLPSATQANDGRYAVAPAQYQTPITAGMNYDNVDLDVAEVVRGQEYPNGPLKEFFFNPYVIGAAIVAAIAIPLAVDETNTNIPGAGGGAVGGP